MEPRSLQPLQSLHSLQSIEMRLREIVPLGRRLGRVCESTEEELDHNRRVRAAWLESHRLWMALRRPAQPPRL